MWVRTDGAFRLARAESLIAAVSDHPTPGVVFRDLTPLFADAEAFSVVVDAIAEPFAGRFDVVAGLEARGFLLAGAVAARTGTGVLPIRKAGKLPRETVAESYDLEYGRATIEAHRDDLPPGVRVLLLDDVLATGGTLAAALRIGERLEWDVVGCGVVLELDALAGRDALDSRVVSVFHV
ncbi:adenine phosphoribosyltransferase [Labedella phragmitis]|uniref:Adenine phosphoribosyltransferase n=1 Tax=Labedella phragmitis TaxID=2498849 RepID=A0A3S3Z6G7_9MICO|nr:adenine phosphoribosyltransferase [Labedella phragmitis]RWZ49750.1 adenine phosphoribosyltransferase [Labedella phragmitis]